MDGTLYTAGDAAKRFTIQSISKAFVYGHALDRLGREAVLKHVGVEPTGESFNSISLDQVHNRPFNPMVNAGAIATAELIEGKDPTERQQALSALMARYAGRVLELDEAVYLSEKATGHRNRAIAFMMLNSGMIKRDPEEVLDLYFRQCSLLVDTRDLALMAATIANDGINPRTGVRALARTHVPDVLTVMNMCGMYNYAGQWSYEIGLPAKSGVSGAIILIIPGQAGIAICPRRSTATATACGAWRRRGRSPMRSASTSSAPTPMSATRSAPNIAATGSARNGPAATPSCACWRARARVSG